jgi:hypothetical protein
MSGIYTRTQKMFLEEHPQNKDIMFEFMVPGT